MRIISAFHDYYDIVRKYGVDPKLVYMRETRELDAKAVPREMDALLHAIPSAFSGISQPHYHKGVVAFCGRAYPFVWCRDVCCFTIDDFVEAWRRPSGACDFDHVKVRTDVITRILHPDSPLEGTRRRRQRGWYINSGIVNFLSWHALLTSDLAVSDEIHRRFGAPVFVVTNALGTSGKFVVVVNPVLKHYAFYRQVGVTEAYQKLAMYVGNNLVVQRDPEVGLTDVKRRDAAGFDGWSFKKHRDDPKVGHEGRRK